MKLSYIKYVFIEIWLASYKSKVWLSFVLLRKTLNSDEVLKELFIFII